MVGEIFHYFTIIGEKFYTKLGNCSQTKAYVVCQCKCGKILVVCYYDLKTGQHIQQALRLKEEESDEENSN